jgi:2'-5' RNA ligase
LRLFVAVDLPGEVSRAIAAAGAAFRLPGLSASWTGPANMHLTLRFLGETDPSRLPAIGSALDAAVSGFATFEIESEGAGVFPSLRAPRVLWAGFREPLELARALQDNIGTALSGAGFPRDPKPFHPHVTIGRIRSAADPGRVASVVASLAGRRFGVVPVSSVLLYESRLSPAGAAYRVIGRHPLGGAPGAEQKATT